MSKKGRISSLQDICLIPFWDDYGNTSDIKQGHGYNGEMKDETGLIYLRARYYDPSIARFIQIDNNYVGEQKEVVTQNRYTYTLNNPYKYVDRDGNRVAEENGGSKFNGPTIVLNGKTFYVMHLTKAQLSQYFGGQKIMNYAVQEINHIMEGWPNKQRQYVIELRSEAKKNTYASNPYGPKGNTPSNPSPTTPKPGPTKPNPSKPKPAPSIECLGELSIIDMISFFKSGIDWISALAECVEMFARGIKVDTISVLSKYVKNGTTIKGIEITAVKAKKLVKDLTGLTAATKIKIADAVKTSVGHQAKEAMKGFTVILAIYGVVSDFLSSLFECIFGTMSWLKVVGNTIASIIYEVIYNLSSTVVRAILTPFIGPFAWIVGLLVDIGLWALDWAINVKERIKDAANWILEQTWSFVTSMIVTVSAKL